MMFSTMACSSDLKRGGAESRGSDAINPKNTALELVVSKMTMVDLERATLVFKVAFEKASDSWQGTDDDAVPGCKITGREAEAALEALNPLMVQRVQDEAKKLLSSPKGYRFPTDVGSCERDCSCTLNLRILQAAKIDDLSPSKAKNLKRLRAQYEAKNELLTSERAEICAESAAWICSSELLKVLKNKP